MAGACTTEYDPASKVVEFVSNSKVRSLSGNRDIGISGLMNIIREEVVRQKPETKVVIIDRDFMGTYKVLTSGELGAALIDLTFGEVSAIFMTEDIPIIKWQEALAYLDKESSQVYFGSLACGQVPLFVKLL